MIKKDRGVPRSLQTLRYLKNRMALDRSSRFYSATLESGLEGELKFDALTKNLPGEQLILNDLLLKYRKSEFQIDTLIILNKRMLLLDIKNYKDEWLVKNGNLVPKNLMDEIPNPFHQLERAQTLLACVLRTVPTAMDITSKLIFIHSEFTLFHADPRLPMILPGQLPRFLENVAKNSSPLNSSHHELASKLIKLHEKQTPHSEKIKFNFDQLRKGPSCENCLSYDLSENNLYFICNDCDHHEKKYHTVRRNIEEFKHLNTDRKITTAKIYGWLNGKVAHRTISAELSRTHQLIGKGKGSFYI